MSGLVFLINKRHSYWKQPSSPYCQHFFWWINADFRLKLRKHNMSNLKKKKYCVKFFIIDYSFFRQNDFSLILHVKDADTWISVNINITYLKQLWNLPNGLDVKCDRLVPKKKDLDMFSLFSQIFQHKKTQ